MEPPSAFFCQVFWGELISIGFLPNDVWNWPGFRELVANLRTSLFPHDYEK